MSIVHCQLSIILDAHGDMLRQNGQLPVPHTGGPVDGMGNGGSGGIDDHFANRLCAPGAGGLVTGHQLYPQLTHIQSGGNLVLHKGAFHGFAVCCVGHVLGQRHANTLHDAAFGLDDGQIGVDGRAAVHHGHIVDDLHMAGQLIQLDLHHAHHKGRRRNRGSVHGGAFRGDGAAQLALYGDLFQRHGSSISQIAHLLALEGQIGRITAQHFGGNGADLTLQLLAGLDDGGAGQVNAVEPVMKRMGFDVPVFGMVKDGKHRTRAITSVGSEISINDNRSVFTLVSDIQEEVHRYAIGYHRKLKEKNTFSSQLLQIPGVGEQRAKKLLFKFGSMSKLREATVEELMQVQGISEATAEIIYKYLRML